MGNRRLQNNDQEKLVRDARIWELRALNSWTQKQIANDVGISQQAVNYVLKKQTAEYRKIYWEKIDDEKTIQVFALKRVARDMWAAWEASKGPQKVIKQTGITDESRGLKNIEIREQHGDPRFVELYLKALKDIRDILGINAATQAHVSITTNNPGDESESVETPLGRFLDGIATAIAARGERTIN